MTEKIFDEYYEKNLIHGGTTCCPGCGGPLFWRMALKVLGENTIVYGDGPCAYCALRNIKLPHFGLHFSFVADGATGISGALRAKGRDDITLISTAGDGASGDISFGKISAAAERNENMIQICVDNEAYMNTGIQKSGLTPFGAWTTTTPGGKENTEKAKGIEGFKYIHTVMPCPTGWRFDPAKAVEVTRLGVDTWTWPLYEIEEGILKMSRKPEQKPVKEYLSAQGRFRGLKDEQLEFAQSWVDSRRTKLLARDGKEITF